jgi:hypothetical protein
VRQARLFALIWRNESLENKVKRLPIESHNFFVANAAVRSCIRSGFPGLNGSQARESQSLFLAYPTSAGDLAEGRLRYFCWFAPRTRRPERRVFHSGSEKSR